MGRRASRRIGLVMAVPLVLSWGVPVVAQEATPEEPAPEWGYVGSTGPDAWGDLDPAWAACGTGTRQSPVDIPADAPLHVDASVEEYAPTPLVVTNNGHAIQVDYAPGSTYSVGGVDHELRQFHLHSPSEHTVAGEQAALELHLVHVNADGGIAVRGVLLVEGEHNEALAPIWEAMPPVESGPVAVEGVIVDADELLPADRSYVTYDGSLTTPPCTEGVIWQVLSEPVELSAEQVSAFRTIHDGTARPVQPLGDRTFE